MSLNQIPRDKNGKPLKFGLVIEAEKNRIGPLVFGRILTAGPKFSVIESMEGGIHEIENSKIRIVIEI